MGCLAVVVAVTTSPDTVTTVLPVAPKIYNRAFVVVSDELMSARAVVTVKGHIPILSSQSRKSTHDL